MSDSTAIPCNPGTVVRKISGKPFKSGSKTATVAGTFQYMVPSGTLPRSTPGNVLRGILVRDFYTFSDEEPGYVVPVGQCEVAPAEPVERVQAHLQNPITPRHVHS